MTTLLKKSINNLFILFVFTGSIFAQSDMTKSGLKEISGYIINNDLPLENVNITLADSKKGVKSNKEGFYSIKAKEGDVIKFSYFGMKPVEVIVEDVTSILNIDMKILNNELDEVVINQKQKEIKSGYSGMDKPLYLPTFYGKINALSGSISYIKGEDLNWATQDLYTAIMYRMPALRPTNFINASATILWDIDGMLFTNPPYIDISEVLDVAVLRSLSDLVLYGTEGRNGVIVVRTKRAYFDVTNPYSDHNPYTNKDYYKGDAENFKNSKLENSKYIALIDSTSTSFGAFKVYKQLASAFKTRPDFYIDVANYFRYKYNNLKYFYEVLNDAESAMADNPESLKALAYIYQEQGVDRKALDIYKKIIRLRPKYAQSFRDLANAYADNAQYKDSWKIYMNYLYRGNKLNEKGIGLTIYNEMESLFTQKKDLSNIRETFVPKNVKDIKKDIRMVFEWNSSEAAFALEFVNPQNQSYTFEHSFYANKELIKDEKSKGFSSMEFFIDKLKKGDWLVNLTYFGNKKYTPTFLKTTVYYHWGLPNQTKEVKVFKLVKKNNKVQLLRLNADMPAYVSSR
jgi:tetratricopeptide (TPR) repeat protein